MSKASQPTAGMLKELIVNIDLLRSGAWQDEPTPPAEMSDDHIFIPHALRDVADRTDQIIRQELNLETVADVEAIELQLEKNSEILNNLRQEIGRARLEFLATSVVVSFLHRRSVSWGYVDLAYREPLFSPINRSAMFFVVVAIDKNYSALRENHGSGYHYHYADASGRRRSDVIFTFSRSPANCPWKVVWEPHGVNKAKFKAGVARWGIRKRESIEFVCNKDAIGFPLSSFLAPGKSAALLV